MEPQYRTVIVFEPTHSRQQTSQPISNQSKHTSLRLTSTITTFAYFKHQTAFQQPNNSLSRHDRMPYPRFLRAIKTASKVTAKWAGFVALIGIVNVVPIMVTERSGFLPQRKFEQGFKDQVSRPGTS
ncbi:MAG: hypothetical protein ALECFALPRED_004414 [Alectoria fallacina]|uniref:Uncharacterized protein n=1 Tax=Alectoria fallacina TaxID=1903189 RepID=A0A8H3FRP1_9LECA|nr:MAG: hypothetical protein ALECFALPRED_004414 [Alectoria fallacina]